MTEQTTEQAATIEVDWRDIFLRYRALIVAEEGIDYLGRVVGEFTDDELLAIADACEEADEQAAEREHHETIARLTSDANAVYLINKGDEGLFLVRNGQEFPVTLTTPWHPMTTQDGKQ